MTISLSVLGASGKMGSRIVKLAKEDPGFRIVGNDLKTCDVAIDFTAPEATLSHLEAAMQSNKPLVIGTTGHTEEGTKAIAEAARIIPILHSPNFSFGAALCLDAAARFAQALGAKCRIEIMETHHIHKKDSPSGTALAFAAAASKGGKICIRSNRTGEVVGEHTIIFECASERIELKHTAHSRDAFAQGALLGAKFLAGKPAGLYSLKDLFC